MRFDIHLGESVACTAYKAYTLREIIFNKLPHRNEEALVVRGHAAEKMIEISLGELRTIISKLSVIIKEKKLSKGDTVLLASFDSSNELANAILFSAFACLGIRIFIPIYPEVNEFDHWHTLTNFKAVIIPYKEILHQKGFEREKEVIRSFDSLCHQYKIPLWDAYLDFDISPILQYVLTNEISRTNTFPFEEELSVQDEAVIFSTSGTSGKSKLVVYDQGAFSLSCQSWQAAGLFEPELCGNPGFTPLFTHTIGIRAFINALWTGQPVCIMVVSWFLQKPEDARYLMLQMQPGHIVGGPALFNTLLEFFRQFPDLKLSLRKSLKTVISIGAPFNKNTARQVKNAIGLNLLNAFGTTETQLVLLNKTQPENNFDHESLGLPLPGVMIGLTATGNTGIYELHIKSPYQSSYIIGETGHESYFSTGDLVLYDKDGHLYYTARKSNDFLKDDFGVKIPISNLKEYYPFLYKIAQHIEWIPLDNKPGLGALLFLNPSCLHYTLKEISEWIKCRNDVLQSVLQPFEFSHRHLERISVAEKPAPLTRKGTVSRKDILLQYNDIITNLKNPYVVEKRIESVDAEQRSNLYKFSDPRLAVLLESLKLDVPFDRGEKDFLFFTQNEKEKKVLDLVGGFGSGLHGHNHPIIREALKNFLDSGRPALNTQGSQYHFPSLLARELNKLFSQSTGRYFKVLFGNTGSEALEIALHHAYFEWWMKLEKLRDEQLQLYGSSLQTDAAAIWEENMKKAAGAPAALMVINNSFHGYSSGARSLLNNKKQRYFFAGLLKPVPLHINDTSKNWREEIDTYISTQNITINIICKKDDAYVVKQEKISNIIASVIEPVRGEGGIYETKTEVCDYLSQQSFPLIADEIQCGLGRTGSLPSYPRASYYLLGKSLGGGYEKISAVLIDDERFKISFPQYYTSTFANGEMAACAALAALRVIKAEKYTELSAKKGEEFMCKLEPLAEKYPGIIESVNGRGLMLGIHFTKEAGQKNNMLRILCENDLLGYLLAGWLFNIKKIRVLPSLSKPNSVRIEPSVYITAHAMDMFCNALEEFCMHFREGNTFELVKYMMNNDPYLDKIVIDVAGNFPKETEAPEPGALRVGFIGNFTSPAKELAVIEPDLQKASATGLRILFNKMHALLDGKSVKLLSKNLMKGKIHFTFYILPFDTAHLEAIHRWGKKRYYIARIQETVNRLSKEGVSHISLGAHTSILSCNGLYIAESQQTKILTGNTLTVASCLYHTERYFEKIHRRVKRPVTIAIAGANGNIGSGLAGCFDEEKYADTKILLLGNNLKKLEQLRKKIFGPGRTVECTTDLFQLQQADIIISCTNSNDPLIFSYHIHPDKKVFVIDIAVPGSVSQEVTKQQNVIFCREASTVYLPDDPDFLVSTHTPVGKIFCCAAEVMLAALYNVQLPLKGHVYPESIKAMMNLAVQEGFFKMEEYATPF